MHNCYNGIGTWFYQALGGLRTDSSHPGYEHVFIDPQIPEGVEWCRIGKETPYGRIDLGWKIADGELRIDVTDCRNLVANSWHFLVPEPV